MSLSATVRAMVEAGCSPEQIALVVEGVEKARQEADAEKKEKVRADAARRQANLRKRRNDNNALHGVTERDEPLHLVTQRDDTPLRADIDNLARADGNPNPSLRSGLLDTPLPTEGTPEEQKTEKPAKAPKGETVQSILGEIFREETVGELVAHRKAKREPLTTGAAKRLVLAVKKWGGDPEAAASEMMLRGWTGFKGEWMAERSHGPPLRGSPVRGGGVATLWAKSLERTANADRTSQERNLEAPRGLPFNNEPERGSGGGDDGGISRPDIKLLVGSAIRRV